MRARNWILILLLIPFVAVLYPPFYAALEPRLFGLSYFLWYQFAWAIISAILTIVVYLVQESGQPDETSPRGAAPAESRREEA